MPCVVCKLLDSAVHALTILCARSSVRQDAWRFGWKPVWQRAKAWLYPAVKKRRKRGSSAASDKNKSSTDSLSTIARDASQTSQQADPHSLPQGDTHA